MMQKEIHLGNLGAVLLGLVLSAAAAAQIPLHSPDENQRLLNEVVDISGDFRNFTNTYYCADRLVEFDPETQEVIWTYRGAGTGFFTAGKTFR